jgi:hypothetical protein
MSWTKEDNSLIQMFGPLANSRTSLVQHDFPIEVQLRLRNSALLLQPQVDSPDRGNRCLALTIDSLSANFIGKDAPTEIQVDLCVVSLLKDWYNWNRLVFAERDFLRKWGFA